LLKMDAKFCRAVERAFRLGLEQRPDEAGRHEGQRRRQARQTRAWC
jgi:hypothetical protein